MRQFFRIVLMALVLLTVALVSALTAMRFAIHGREVVIPKLIGATPVEAERAAAPSGLGVIVERQYYSPDIPEGKIISQVPPPGAKVRRGWTIRVAQSLGPQRVAIPDVTGESERVAELNIRRRGLDLGSTAQLNWPDSPPDQVVSQSPPANASGVLVPKISLLVSDTPGPAELVMPNFVGSPLGSATVALQEAGIKVGKVTVVSPNPPANEPATTTATPVPLPQPGAASMIVTQNPAQGQKVAAGSAVTFEVH
jgi:eukaryotic-like serine/threonine-protein kinase